MRSFVRGEKSKLADLTPSQQVTVTVQFDGPDTYDVSLFGVDANSKLSDDRYFIFFNQLSSPEGAINASGLAGGGVPSFQVDLSRLPGSIQRLVFTAAIDGNGTMSGLRSGALKLSVGGAEVASFPLSGSDFAAEKALMIAELYVKDVWRFAAVGQGFNGGLSALLAHFGGEEAGGASTPPAPAPAPAPAPTPAPAPAPAGARTVQLEKRLAGQPAHVVDLVKRAGVSLEKRGLADHRARVALCLDISASMTGLFKSGKVQALCERVLALAVNLDDDGSCDVFTFGQHGHHEDPLDLNNRDGWIKRLLKRRDLEGGTNYNAAMHMVREFYFPDSKGGPRTSPRADSLPVYVMFVTDGQTTNESMTRNQVMWSSYEPIFWQFMAIGKSSRDAIGTAPVQPKKRGLGSRLSGFLNPDFGFLEELDDMPGRHVDNADFFSVSDPAGLDDTKLYELMMNEYPQWLQDARAKGLLR